MSLGCSKKSKIPSRYEKDNINFKKSIILLNEARDLSNPSESQHEPSFTLSNDIEAKIISKTEDGIRLGKEINDAYLDFLHPELKIMFKDKLLKGTDFYYDGLKDNNSGKIAEGLKKQIQGNELVIEWIRWWDKNGKSIADKLYSTNSQFLVTLPIKIFILIILILFVSALCAYTSNFQSATLIIGKKLSPDNPLLPTGFQDAITPKAQTLRNISIPILFILLFIISLSFVKWYVAVINILITLLLIPFMKLFMPKVTSSHYLNVMRKHLRKRLRHYERIDDKEGVEAVNFLRDKLEQIE